MTTLQVCLELPALHRPQPGRPTTTGCEHFTIRREGKRTQTRLHVQGHLELTALHVPQPRRLVTAPRRQRFAIRRESQGAYACLVALEGRFELSCPHVP